MVNIESSAENSPEAVVEAQKVSDVPEQPISGSSDEVSKKPGELPTL